MLSTDELMIRFHRALKVAGETHTVEDVAQAVKDGKMQSWQSGQSVVVTEVLATPQKRLLNVFLVTGNLEEVMSIQPALIAFGKQHDCSKIVMRGRRGWRKVLPKYGWKAPAVTYELPIV